VKKSASAGLVTVGRLGAEAGSNSTGDPGHAAAAQTSYHRTSTPDSHPDQS
jgi:hypothetical protein